MVSTVERASPREAPKSEAARPTDTGPAAATQRRSAISWSPRFGVGMHLPAERRPHSALDYTCRQPPRVTAGKAPPGALTENREACNDKMLNRREAYADRNHRLRSDGPDACAPPHHARTSGLDRELER